MSSSRSSNGSLTPMVSKGDPPVLRPDGNSWEERVLALAGPYQEEWVKYGPFGSRKSALNCASRMRTQLSRRFSGYILDSHVDPDFCLNVRVRKNKRA